MKLENFEKYANQCKQDCIYLLTAYKAMYQTFRKKLIFDYYTNQEMFERSGMISTRIEDIRNYAICPNNYTCDYGFDFYSFCDDFREYLSQTMSCSDGLVNDLYYLLSNLIDNYSEIMDDSDREYWESQE